MMCFGQKAAVLDQAEGFLRLYFSLMKQELFLYSCKLPTAQLLSLKKNQGLLSDRYVPT